MKEGTNNFIVICDFTIFLNSVDIFHVVNATNFQNGRKVSGMKIWVKQTDFLWHFFCLAELVLGDRVCYNKTVLWPSVSAKFIPKMKYCFAAQSNSKHICEFVSLKLMVFARVFHKITAKFYLVVAIDYGNVSGIQNKVWNVWLGPEPSVRRLPGHSSNIWRSRWNINFIGDGRAALVARKFVIAARKAEVGRKSCTKCEDDGLFDEISDASFHIFRNFCFNYEFYSGHIFE